MNKDESKETGHIVKRWIGRRKRFNWDHDNFEVKCTIFINHIHYQRMFIAYCCIQAFISSVYRCDNMFLSIVPENCAVSQKVALLAAAFLVVSIIINLVCAGAM